MDIDLSEQLRPRPKREPVAPRVAPTSSSSSTKGRTQAARLSMRATAGAAAAQRGPSTGNYARMPPRANEEKRWKRSSKFNSQVRPLLLSFPDPWYTNEGNQDRHSMITIHRRDLPDDMLLGCAR